MKFIKSFLVSFILTFHTKPSCAIDPLEECRQTDDEHETRGNFTCCASSPRKVPLLPSLNFADGWKKCAIEPESSSEDPVISAWRVYRCIVFLGIRGKPLLPTTYAALMTSKYPALIQTHILNKMSELEDENMKFEVDVECLKRTPYPKVHLLRDVFYTVEQQICESDVEELDLSEAIQSSRIFSASSGKVSAPRSNGKKRDSIPTWTPTSLAEILCETCDRSHAVYHRNADCCSHVPLPFPFLNIPYRYGSEERVKQCAEDLVDDVGLPSDTEFSKHLQYLCHSSCEQYLSGNLEESDLWGGMSVLQSQSEIKALINKIMPKYFSSKYKNEALRYVLEHFREAWKETKTFESKVQFSQLDSRNCDKDKLMNLLTSCKTHKLIETVMNLYLNNLCIEVYPLEDPNATTPKSLFFAFVNMTTPVPSLATSANDVTLNFEWGSSSRSNRGHGKATTDKTYRSFSYNLTTSRPNTWWDYTTTPTSKSRGNFIKVYY